MFYMGKRRGGGGGGNAQQERVRTHLFFSSKPERQHTKRKRHPQNVLHQASHKKDEMIQVGEIDPSQWTGNQRVLHYGPMAQRDPYFYYYPKGWDIIYPAHFGFFPYRTKKFRGSSSLVCTSAFGVFLIMGGIMMVYLGFFVMYDSPFWTWPFERRKRPPPIQIAGPILLVVGAVLLVCSLVYAVVTSNVFKLSLHHTKHHHEPSKVTTITHHYSMPGVVFEKDPYQPLPPPAYPVLENRHAHSNIVRPHDEMKLYPPVLISVFLDVLRFRYMGVLLVIYSWLAPTILFVLPVLQDYILALGWIPNPSWKIAELALWAVDDSPLNRARNDQKVWDRCIGQGPVAVRSIDHTREASFEQDVPFSEQYGPAVEGVQPPIIKGDQ